MAGQGPTAWTHSLAPTRLRLGVSGKLLILVGPWAIMVLTSQGATCSKWVSISKARRTALGTERGLHTG